MSLEELYRKDRDKFVRRANYILHNHHTAEEAVQDAFVKAHINFGAFDPDKASLNTWFSRILMNCVWDIKRVDKRSPQTVPLEDFLESGQLARISEAEVLSAIASVTNPLHRRMLHHMVILGYSYKELGSCTGASQNSIRKVWERFRERLEKEYNARI